MGTFTFDLLTQFKKSRLKSCISIVPRRSTGARSDERSRRPVAQATRVPAALQPSLFPSVRRFTPQSGVVTPRSPIPLLYVSRAAPVTLLYLLSARRADRIWEGRDLNLGPSNEGGQGCQKRKIKETFMRPGTLTLI